MGGTACSHLNITAVGSISQASLTDAKNIIQIIRGDSVELQGADALFERRLEEIMTKMKIKKTSSFEAEEVAAAARRKANRNANCVRTMEEFRNILQELNFHPSDQAILQDLYCLLDKHGREDLDVRDCVCAFSILLAESLNECLDFAFRLYDTESQMLLEKKQMQRIFSVLNSTLLFFGDVYLSQAQVKDLVDSIFTSAGKIDGSLYYPDYIEYVIDHPIVAMLLSPQNQGRSVDKIRSDMKDLEKLIIDVPAV
jgi:Ca2+-binding EF-hand superfamily protein